MNTIINRFLLLSTILAMIFITGCKQDEINYFDAENNAVRFPGISGIGAIADTLWRNYNESTKVFSLWYSFLLNPMAEFADVELPVIHMGIPPEKDIQVTLAVVQDTDNATAGQYELLGGFIPAGQKKGNIIIRVYNDAALDSITRQVHLTISPTEEYKCGPEAYLNAVLFWNNEIPRPTVANAIRSYNMMIAGNANFIATTLTHYSPRAHKVILAATGWTDLPLYTTIYAGNLYLGYAKMIEAYIAEYNAAHPGNPLLHDGGAFAGLPIEARKY